MKILKSLNLSFEKHEREVSSSFDSNVKNLKRINLVGTLVFFSITIKWVLEASNKELESRAFSPYFTLMLALYLLLGIFARKTLYFQYRALWYFGFLQRKTSIPVIVTFLYLAMLLPLAVLVKIGRRIKPKGKSKQSNWQTPDHGFEEIDFSAQH